jgi:4'-phosphopantetheinyl transferase
MDAGGGVDVWIARLAPDSERSPQVRARAWLPEVLARYTGGLADDIVIGTEGDGRPIVVDRDRPGWPRFSVSHSGEVAVIAVRAVGEVGVDVEAVRADLGWREVARAFFAPEEVVAIEELPDSERRAAFFDCWVRKEAYVKALGTGLRRDTTNFAVPLDPAGGVVRDDAAGGPSWRVRPVAIGPGYAAAVATDGDGDDGAVTIYR